MLRRFAPVLLTALAAVIVCSMDLRRDPRTPFVGLWVTDHAELVAYFEEPRWEELADVPGNLARDHRIELRLSRDGTFYQDDARGLKSSGRWHVSMSDTVVVDLGEPPRDRPERQWLPVFGPVYWRQARLQLNGARLVSVDEDWPWPWAGMIRVR